MKKTISILGIVVAIALVLCSCSTTANTVASTTLAAATSAAVSPTSAATATPQPTVEATAEPTATPTAEPTAAPTVAPTADESKPMTIVNILPDGFEPSEDESTDTLKVYRDAAAYIELGVEATTDQTSAPKDFLKSILASLPKEKNVSGYKFTSSKEEGFASYPMYTIKWTTGANEDSYINEAHFILTDDYIYRVQYSMNANFTDDENPKMAAFFKSIDLKD
jgi:hypothetical protein